MSLTRNRPLLLVPAATLAVVLLAGCASDAADTATPEVTASPTTGQEDGDAARPAGGGAGGGGTRGEVAAITGTVMQVQGDDGQTAVSWTDATTITQTVAGTLADVTAGVCVVAFTGSSQDAADAATATSVAVSVPTDDGCGSGFGGGGGREMPAGAAPTGRPDASGDAPTGMPTDLPTDLPTDMPTDMPGGAGGGFGGLATGRVTAVSGTTITLEVTGQDDAVTTTTVEVSDATTYTTTATADASAVVVGRCVTAQGETDDSGQVAATSLVLSEPSDDGCSTGFGGTRGRGDGA
jgi:hypothetical protein